MERAAKWKWLFCVSCLCCAGCDQMAALEVAAIPGLSRLAKEESPAPKAVATTGKVSTTGNSRLQTIQHADPGSVVTGFLDAIKRADNETLTGLLTDRARETCSANGIQLAVSKEHPLAASRVLQADYLPGGGAAHVRCLWFDAAAGDAAPRELVVVLRAEDNQWRIVGMVVEGEGGSDVFNLESDIELRSLSSI